MQTYHDTGVQNFFETGKILWERESVYSLTQIRKLVKGRPKFNEKRPNISYLPILDTRWLVTQERYAKYIEKKFKYTNYLFMHVITAEFPSDTLIASSYMKEQVWWQPIVFIYIYSQFIQNCLENLIVLRIKTNIYTFMM